MHSESEEAKNYDFSIQGRTYYNRNVKFIWDKLECQECEIRFWPSKIKNIERDKKRGRFIKVAFSSWGSKERIVAEIAEDGSFIIKEGTVFGEIIALQYKLRKISKRREGVIATQEFQDIIELLKQMEIAKNEYDGQRRLEGIGVASIYYAGERFEMDYSNNYFNEFKAAIDAIQKSLNLSPAIYRQSYTKRRKN